MRLADFQALSFDCYGTLIDWESGLLEALRPLMALVGVQEPSAVLGLFARHEHAQEQATPGMLYSELLVEVSRRIAAERNVAVDEPIHRAFGASVPTWPAFPDSAAALAYLKQHHKLIVLSNVDKQSFAGSQKRLGVEFDAVYTAEEIGSYKPSSRNFEFLLDRARRDLGIEPALLLHTAQSLFHDHVPAKRIGLATAWIDRRHDQPGWGATVAPDESPRTDFRFTSMTAMADAHRAELAGSGRD